MFMSRQTVSNILIGFIMKRINMMIRAPEDRDKTSIAVVLCGRDR